MADNARIRFEMNPQFIERLGQTIEKRSTKKALDMVSMIVASISIGQPVQRYKSKSGRVYLRGLSPSQPGEPPHVLYGELRKHIMHEVKRTATQVITRVGTNLKYALRLEKGFVGTDSKGRNVHQKPRPYLRPALSAHFKNFLS